MGDCVQVQLIIELGFLMGIGGVVIFKNGGLVEIIFDIGIEYLVLEIDVFYLVLILYCGK